ncbi:homeobox protein Hox-D12-like isoform X1 [Chiloscyllium plagiosum]|uniref:homeobox protein Hox-D12-like isoform X1 n=1 Tax=Chiloscyllium plagiosum TaxID=36176 RepID=UPI001CB87595|nr:homeobox protein Hox-D12-like isoform X1 [Chiloscyllium plagiosum]
MNPIIQFSYKMDSTSLRYELTLETSSDKTGLREDEVRPTEMVPVFSTNFGTSALSSSPLKTTSSGRHQDLCSEDISTCGSHGSAGQEIVAMSPGAVQIPANQLQNDCHMSPFISYRHNFCTRGEYPTNPSLYQHWPLEYPQVAPVQTQANPNNQSTPAFYHSQYSGTSFEAGTLNNAMPGVPRPLALGLASHWSTSQNPTHRQRKKRIPYSKQQIAELERAFENNRFLTPEVRLNISFRLGLTERQVKTWFQNQRQKEKRLLRVQQQLIKPSCPGL